MGRKIKSVLLLLIVLSMIYYQHSPLTYAQNAESEESGQEDTGQENTEQEDEESEEESQETEKTVSKYELDIPKADGENGYYKTIPEIRLRHVSEAGSTWYCFYNENELIQEGVLYDTGEEVRFSEEQFKEGNNRLTVYMENEDGRRLSEYDFSEEFLVDTLPPQFTVEAEKGFSEWYQKEAWIHVSGNDGQPGSQIDSISCYCENQLISTIKETEGDFLISHASKNGNGVNVTVTVTDQAGNKSEQTKKLYIDSSPPQIWLEGASDYMITGEPVQILFKCAEDNKIKEKNAVTEWEDTDGVKQLLYADVWEEEGGQICTSGTYTEDGIYRICMKVTDMAGYVTEKALQVIIDSHDPVIRYVDKLNGQFVKLFQWNYPTEMFIEDFTTYTYQIQLDGKVYPSGKEVTEEGQHLLCVAAEDAAGNKAEAKASFVIDRTAPEIMFTGVEQDGIYEEERTFRIALKDPEDQIQEVRINHILQYAEDDEKPYEYTVQEHRNYEVEVKAVDQAGNQTTSYMSFQIIPQKTVLQKLADPIKKMTLKKAEKKEKDDHYGIIILPAAAILIILTAIIIQWHRKKRALNREDAG